MAYPRIWDRCAERKIIGETKLSWLIEQSWTHTPAKINKKTPNRHRSIPQWFFDERERDLTVWADANFNGIKRFMGEYSRNLTPEILHRVAELIGYMPTLTTPRMTRGSDK